MFSLSLCARSRNRQQGPCDFSHFSSKYSFQINTKLSTQRRAAEFKAVTGSFAFRQKNGKIVRDIPNSRSRDGKIEILTSPRCLSDWKDPRKMHYFPGSARSIYSSSQKNEMKNKGAIFWHPIQTP